MEEGHFLPCWHGCKPCDLALSLKGTAAEAARADPVTVSLELSPARPVMSGPLVVTFNLTQVDCCPFAMLVDVEWRLQAPDGTHILQALQASGAAEVVADNRLVLSAGALLPAGAAYTVGLVARHTATGAVLGMALKTLTYAVPPPEGVFEVQPASGMPNAVCGVQGCDSSGVRGGASL